MSFNISAVAVRYSGAVAWAQGLSRHDGVRYFDFVGGHANLDHDCGLHDRGTTRPRIANPETYVVLSIGAKAIQVSVHYVDKNRNCNDQIDDKALIMLRTRSGHSIVVISDRVDSTWEPRRGSERNAASINLRIFPSIWGLSCATTPGEMELRRENPPQGSAAEHWKSRKSPMAIVACGNELMTEAIFLFTCFFFVLFASTHDLSLLPKPFYLRDTLIFWFHWPSPPMRLITLFIRTN